MKIKLDENMPQALADLLRETGHDPSTVPQEKLAGAPDPSVLREATSEGRLLMTFDTDFCNVLDYPPGTHAGIVVFRLHDQRSAALRDPAQRLVESGVLERLRRGLAIVDEMRVRVRTGEPRV